MISKIIAKVIKMNATHRCRSMKNKKIAMEKCKNIMNSSIISISPERQGQKRLRTVINKRTDPSMLKSALLKQPVQGRTDKYRHCQTSLAIE
jgi:hypothetical protein